jgi:AcrR family transcriptional regulator
MTSNPELEPLTPERRRQMTQDHLLRAAADVFEEKGFYGASLDEVAARAGFSKGAVYSNFRNKEDLFLALLGSIYAHAMEALHATIESSATPTESRLADFVALIRGQGIDAGNSWSVLYEEFHLYALRNPVAREKLVELDRHDVDQVARVIDGERRRHGFRPLESSTDAARIVIALMHGVGMMRSLDPDLADDDEFLSTVMAFIARALTSAPDE